MASENHSFSQHDPAPDIITLVEYLKTNDDSHYSYRGQSHDYGVLLPSYFRGLLYDYYHRNEKIFDLSRRKQIASQTTRDRQRERAIHWLCDRFGQALGNLLGQQYGMRSETLDVTDDPEVAGFFATRAYPDFSHVKSSDKPGVIYRWRHTHDSFEEWQADVGLKENMGKVYTEFGSTLAPRLRRLSVLSSDERSELMHDLIECRIWVPPMLCSGRDVSMRLRKWGADARAALNASNYHPDLALNDVDNSRWVRQKGGYIRPEIWFYGFIEGDTTVDDLPEVSRSGLVNATIWLDQPSNLGNLFQADVDIFYFRHSSAHVSIAREYLFPDVFEDYLFGRLAKLLGIQFIEYLQDAAAYSPWDRYAGILDRGFYDPPSPQLDQEEKEVCARLMEPLAKNFRNNR